MNTKIYDIKRTDKYRCAENVYISLSDNDKYKIEDLISKEVYSALLFNFHVLRKIEDYCCAFFECSEKGLSYEIGCYFQKREYQHEGFIQRDIDKFSALLKVYNKEIYPQEYNLIKNLVTSLCWFKKKWAQYEESHPELFE